MLGLPRYGTGFLSDSTCTASNHANLSCTDCHSEVEGLATVHQETKKSKPGKINRLDYPVSEETCFGCHESKEALAERTADCTVLTDSKGTVVNPHAIPENEGHKKQANAPTATACIRLRSLPVLP